MSLFATLKLTVVSPAMHIATRKMNQVTGAEGQTTISNRNSATSAAIRTQAGTMYSTQSLYNDEVKSSFTLINIFHRYG